MGTHPIFESDFDCLTDMDIWAQFGREAQAKKANDVSVFFIGAQNGGKSTLIGRLVEDKSDKGIKATMGLEYQYIRRQGQLCHIWEGGGALDSSLIKMIDIPLQTAKLVVFTLILDLSDLAMIESTCQHFHKLVKSASNVKKMKLLIIGTKYDRFSSLPNDTKHSVNTYIRLFAKQFNGAIIQISHQNESNILKYKKLLNHLIFKSSSHQKNETDISKNLIIIDDSHEAIGEKSLPSARDQMDGFVKQQRHHSGGSKRDAKRSANRASLFAESAIDAAVKEYASQAQYRTLANSAVT